MFMLGRDSSDEPHAHSLTGGFWADVLSLIKSPSFSLVTRGGDSLQEDSRQVLY